MKKWEVWQVDAPDLKGREQSGLRPAIVLASCNGLTTAIPLTKNTYRLTLDYTELVEPCKENGLDVESVALVFQITSYDDKRFKNQRGFIPQNKRSGIETLVKDYLKV